MKDAGIRRYAPIAGTVLLTVMCIGTATGVQRTVISLYAEQLLSSKSTLTYVILYLPIFIFGILKGTVDLLGGWLSDRFGRKNVIIAGSLLYMIGALLLYLGNNLTALVMANTMIGSGQGMLLAGAMIALSDLSSSSEQALSFGLMESFVYGGYTIGAVLAGYISELKGIKDSFIISLTSAALALAISTSTMRETREIPSKKQDYVKVKEMNTIDIYKTCLKSWTLRVAYFLGHLASFSDVLIWGTFPLYLYSRGLTQSMIGFIQGASTLTWAISMPFAGKISDVLGRRVLSTVGLMIKAFGIISILNSTSFALNLVAASLIGLGTGLYYPIMPAISTDVVPSNVKGRALGLFRAIRDYGYFTGAIFLGIVTSAFSYQHAFYVTVALLGVGTLAIFAGIKETRPFWPALELVEEHVLKVMECCEAMNEMIKLHTSGKKEDVLRLSKRIKQLESQADSIRLRIDRDLWFRALHGQDKADLSRLSEKIDRIAAYLLGASRRLILLDPETIPSPMKAKFNSMGDKCLEVMEKLVSAVKVIREDRETALLLAEEVGGLETNYDMLHLEASRELMEMADGLKPLTLLNIRDFIDLMEYAVDAAEDASDIIRVLIFKHSAWPI